MIKEENPEGLERTLNAVGNQSLGVVMLKCSNCKHTVKLSTADLCVTNRNVGDTRQLAWDTGIMHCKEDFKLVRHTYSI
jgi:exosome complex RNA-binding protein Csl4